MGKRMVPAIQVQEGNMFRWQNTLYVVTSQAEPDAKFVKMTVQRVASYWPEESNPGNSGWKFVEERHRHHEDFNECCEVDVEFSQELQHA